MDCPFIPKPCRRNRERITALMGKHGFIAYPFEFWHYSAGDAYIAHLAGSKEPAKYGPVDWDPATGRVTPIENPAALLNSDSEIMAKMEKALKALINPNDTLSRSVDLPGLSRIKIRKGLMSSTETEWEQR